VISYEEILDIYWNSHNPTSQPWSRQYMSMIFYHDAWQQKAAQQSKEAMEKKLGREIKTELVAFSKFYLAEDYHQKYYLQAEPQLAMEIRGYYKDFSGFINSTAAARLNGLLGGYGDPQLLAEEIDQYGLSAEAKTFLQGSIR
jgi:peptide-methionine (S)-S-oxide reductase